MKYFNKCHPTLVSLIALAYIGTNVEQAKAQTITPLVTWISKDRSVTSFNLVTGETVLLPMKGGGISRLNCGAPACSMVFRDFKDKKGKITYERINLAGLQNVSGTIDSGTGRFEIEVSGLEGLFRNSVITADLTNSTGLNATIGAPGDQLSQGGTISFSTQWFSDQPIGVDPLTGNEIILGEFFLDSTAPLTAFEYTVTNPDTPLISSTFTIGEKYRFSSGLEIDGTVTKEFETIPEPTTILGSGLALGLGTLFKKEFSKKQKKAKQKK